MISVKAAVEIINHLGIKLDKFSIEDFITGYNIELEHGLINKFTNVSNNDPIITAKIALAHLNEFPDYYNKDYGLPAFEKFLENKNRLAATKQQVCFLILLKSSVRDVILVLD